MAVTHGHGNPNWSRDEVILALALYFECGASIPGPDDERVLALSKVLRTLPIHVDAAKNDRFRNPDGVAFKLQNLRQVATGHGLGNTSATDRAVWADYGDKPELVRELAARIRIQGEAPEVAAVEVSRLQDDEEFIEGRVLTTLHKVRERSAKVRRELLKARRASGGLTCDACGEGPKTDHLPGLDGSGFEGHHVVPLAATSERATRLKDMALLCATCHRVLHRVMHLQRKWVTVEDLRGMLRSYFPAQK